MPEQPRLIVGISGTSGVIYGVRLLELLRESAIETHLVMNKSAAEACPHELDRKAADVRALADTVHPPANIAATISSGSFKTMGMIVAPCSIHSLSEIATGVTSNLLTRAADVVLKERRRLVLLVFEAPLHAGHLESMVRVSEMGAVVSPPVPAFYPMPESIGDIVDHTLGRVLDLFDIDVGRVRRWGESIPAGPRRLRAVRRKA